MTPGRNGLVFRLPLCCPLDLFWCVILTFLAISPRLSAVTFKLNGYANLQKLTVNKIGLAYHYVWAASVVEKPRVLISEPFFDYSLQHSTLKLAFITFIPIYYYCCLRPKVDI